MDPYGNEPITIAVTVTAVGVITAVVIIVGVAIVSYYVVKALWEVGAWLADLTCYAWAEITYFFEDEISERAESVEVAAQAATRDPFDDYDDDYDDDYYDDDNNFGGRQKVGKNKGNTPRNNQAQNKQFRDATKDLLNKDQQRALHDEITGEGLGFHDILDAAKNLWFFFIGLFDVDDQ